MPSDVSLILASTPEGTNVPLYTLKLRYWRAVHGEVMTHRVFSRNASSSRAIPIKSMTKTVLTDTAGPDHWGTNQKGMQAGEENNTLVAIPTTLYGAFSAYLDYVSEGSMRVQDLKADSKVRVHREMAWQFSAWMASEMSMAYSEADYHKQIGNRLTEPFQYINVVVSSTEWQNFFDLRCHPDAMPEFQDLARSIRDCIEAATPQVLKEGEWHIPYILAEEVRLPVEQKLKLSAARCAGTSYQTVEGQPMSMLKAEDVFQKLMGGKPFHASPTEHQAKVSAMDGWVTSNFHAPWVQYRTFVEHEWKIR